RVDTLHLQRFEDQRLEFRILGQFQPDLLDQLSGSLDIAVIGDTHRELVDGPVAALVLDRAQHAERHGVERAALMPQLDRADAEAFDGALIVAALDVFADAEGIVEQVEHAGDDVADKILTPKPIATPTTLKPATSGPISKPIAASTISTATAITTTNRILRKIGSSVRIRARR